MWLMETSCMRLSSSSYERRTNQNLGIIELTILSHLD